MWFELNLARKWLSRRSFSFPSHTLASSKSKLRSGVSRGKSAISGAIRESAAVNRNTMWMHSDVSSSPAIFQLLKSKRSFKFLGEHCLKTFRDQVVEYVNIPKKSHFGKGGERVKGRPTVDFEKYKVLSLQRLYRNNPDCSSLQLEKMIEESIPEKT